MLLDWLDQTNAIFSNLLIWSVSTQNFDLEKVFVEVTCKQLCYSNPLSNTGSNTPACLSMIFYFVFFSGRCRCKTNTFVGLRFLHKMVGRKLKLRIFSIETNRTFPVLASKKQLTIANLVLKSYVLPCQYFCEFHFLVFVFIIGFTNRTKNNTSYLI